MERLGFGGLPWVAVLAGLLVSCGPDDGPAPAPASTPAPTPAPSISVLGEARLLKGTGTTTLSQPVSSVSAVYAFDNAGQKVAYVEGRDWVATGNFIARAAASRIPDFGTYDYVRSAGEKFAFASDPRNPPLTITYNVYIDYVSPQADPTLVARPLARPTRSVLCLGDSIAQGAHTVEQYYRNLDSQSWCGLLRSWLGPAISVRNEAVVGGTVSAIASDLPLYAAIPADSVIVAFGMNDHVFEPVGGVAEFTQQLDQVVTTYLQRGSNVILVGFFQQNELWNLEDASKTFSYNQAIRTVAQSRSIPFIDAYSAYEGIRTLGDPQFLHLTADFMHHPNVYGQRVYYSLMVPYFLSANTPSAQIPNYVIGPWSR